MSTIIIVLFLTAYIVVVFFTRRKNNFFKFSIGNKSIGVFALFASVSATFIGPGFTLGLVNQGFQYGYFLFIPVAFYAIQIIVSGVFIAPKLRQKFSEDTFSIGDVIGGKYTHNNNLVQLITGLIAFALCVGFSTVMASAGGEIVESVFNIPKFWGIVIITGLSIGYSYWGGLTSTVYTDVFLFLIFVVIIPALAVVISMLNIVDIEIFISEANSLTKQGYNNHNVYTMVGLVASFLFGEFMLPPFLNRALAGRSETHSSKAFIYSGVFLIFWLLLMFTFGIFGKLLIQGEASDKILLLLGKEYFSPGLFVVFSFGLIGVVVSSMDALLNSSATIFTRDILNIISKQKWNKEYDTQLKFSRVATLVAGIFSIVFATSVPSVLNGLLFCYSLWVPAVIVPLLASVFLRVHHWKSALFSMISGILVSIIWGQFLNLEKFFPSIIIGLLSSGVTYFLCHYWLVVKQHGHEKLQS